MVIENLSIAELRLEASRYRARADAIDAAIAVLEINIGTATASEPPPKPTFIAARSVARKGKQPGSISQKWKGVLWEMAEQQHPTQGLSTADITVIVQKTLGQNKRPAELARQFEPYKDADYVVQPFGDHYLVTPKGKSKVGFIPASESIFAGVGQFVNLSSQEEVPGE